MEKAKLDWKTFSLRRRLDVSAWLKAMKMKSYEDLVAWCESKDMLPPSKEEVSEHFKAPKPQPVTKVTKKVMAKPKKVEEKPPVEKEVPTKEEEEKPKVPRRGRSKKKAEKLDTEE